MALWQTVSAASDWQTDLDIRVARTRTPADNDAALEIRRRVFAVEQRVADLRVSDPDDTRSIIALARVMTAEGLVPASTGRLTLSPLTGGPALVAWVATLPEWRGHGIAHQRKLERAGAPSQSPHLWGRCPAGQRGADWRGAHRLTHPSSAEKSRSRGRSRSVRRAPHAPDRALPE